MPRALTASMMLCVMRFSALAVGFESQVIPATQHTQEPPDYLLVGCVKQKSDRAGPARDVYASPLWRCRREYAKRLAVPWFILSAKYGLLAPDTHIEPYDLSLADLSPAERRAWSQEALGQFKNVTADLAEKTIEIHAGKLYVEYGLERELRQAGAEVYRPLAHIPGIGSQMTWYKAYLVSRHPRD